MGGKFRVKVAKAAVKRRRRQLAPERPSNQSTAAFL
jgi:hypothetical protein